MENEAALTSPPPFPEVAAYIERVDGTIAAGNASIQLERKIELDIAALEAATSLLRVSRNSCRPLLRLPSEILGEVAAALASIWPSTAGFSNYMRYSRPKKRTGLELGWILLAHVCHTLRAAVLARQDLWAKNICTATRTHPKELHPYYGKSPLHINLEIYNPHDEPAALPSAYIDFLAQHMHLASDVNLYEWGRWSDDALFANLDPGLFAKATFPHLQQLRLRSDTSPYGVNHPPLTEEIFELLEIKAPSLQSLHLKNYVFPFDPSSLRSLTLEFSNPPTLYSRQAFMQMLRRAPNLRSLHLGNCIPPLALCTNISEQTVLAILEDLHLEDNARWCLESLSHLSLPSSTCPHIEAQDIHTEFPNLDVSEVLKTILPHFEHMDTSNVTGLSIDEWAMTSISLYSPMLGAQTSASRSFSEDFRKNLHIELYRVSGVTFRLEAMMSCLQTFMDLKIVTALQIDSYVLYDTATWTACFARFTSVTSLTLGSMRQVSLLSSLTAPQTDDSITAEPYQLALPRLRYLCITLLDLREARQTQGARQPVPCRLPLLRMLSSRLKAGYMLEHLRIETLVTSDLNEAQKSFVPRLEALASQVEVDEITRRDPETDSGEEEEEDEQVKSEVDSEVD